MSTANEPARLALLFHHRWSVPVLALLAPSGGGRFAEFVHALGVSRDSLRTTLAALRKLGLIERNPGYGHPLRPEYILTLAGRGLAPVAEDFMSRARRVELEELALRKWPMAALREIGSGAGRFSELSSRLAPITARALAGALKDLDAAGLVSRTVTADYPPAVAYAVTRAGRGWLPELERLAGALERDLTLSCEGRSKSR
ncbi:helix-turn-helix transcriptional regulator [Candidatus Poribacteria bacterium]|nr:helix-turn-helix transcriptional regulator [Candidatus Poribacteria bacterium]